MSCGNCCGGGGGGGSCRGGGGCCRGGGGGSGSDGEASPEKKCANVKKHKRIKNSVVTLNQLIRSRKKCLSCVCVHLL